VFSHVRPRVPVVVPTMVIVVIMTAVDSHPASKPRIMRETATALAPGNAQPWSF